jgi:hypothetical protein
MGKSSSVIKEMNGGSSIAIVNYRRVHPFIMDLQFRDAVPALD